MDSNNTLGYVHAARAYAMLGNVRSARLMYGFLTSVLPFDASWLRVEAAAIDEVDQYAKLFSEGNFNEARKCVARVAVALGKTAATEGHRVECLLYLRPEEAAEEIQALAAEYGDHSIVLFLRAKSLFYTGTDPITTSTAAQFVLRAIASSTNCERAKALEVCIHRFESLRSDLQSHNIHKRWQLAVDACTAMLQLDEAEPPPDALRILPTR
jgi:hypothetical protein